MCNIFRYFKEISLLIQGFGFIFSAKYVLLTITCLKEVLALRSLGPVDKKVKDILNVKSHGLDFIFLAYTLPVVREIHLHDCYGFNTGRRYGTVIDLGANSGTFTSLAAKVSEKVIAVECNTSGLMELFNETMRTNNLQNTIFINKFISSNSSKNKVSINQLISDHAIASIDFLKIDIEGAETDLFSSNLEWLRITKEISMEVHPCFGVNVTECISILNAHGFITTLLDKNLKVAQGLPGNGMGYIRARR